MNKLSRRQFLGKSVLGLGSVFAAAQFPLKFHSVVRKGNCKNAYRISVMDCQGENGTDFPGTLKMVAAMGYQSIEMCSPVGYETLGFGGSAEI